jgi:hypothetical protein
LAKGTIALRFAFCIQILDDAKALFEPRTNVPEATLKLI